MSEEKLLPSNHFLSIDLCIETIGTLGINFQEISPI
jgi:hypothetical protein